MKVKTVRKSSSSFQRYFEFKNHTVIQTNYMYEDYTEYQIMVYQVIHDGACVCVTSKSFDSSILAFRDTREKLNEKLFEYI